MNVVVLTGRLTADPELHTTPNGVSVTSFTVAVNRNSNRELTDFINIVAWRQQAEFVTRNFRKGKSIMIIGELQTRTYEDRSGNKRKAVEVVADRVEFAGGKDNDNRTNDETDGKEKQRYFGL